MINTGSSTFRADDENVRLPCSTYFLLVKELTSDDVSLEMFSGSKIIVYSEHVFALSVYFFTSELFLISRSCLLGYHMLILEPSKCLYIIVKQKIKT